MNRSCCGYCAFSTVCDVTRQVWEGSSKMVFVSVAMYRRYRPQSFQEVIGQDHVVAPLKAALAAGRTTHAYLFSGPRGCGKTTSARILARCLNCANYPTDTPCGVCESCRDLARDGAGSLDVVELDAASHGGVDDARDLREQAGFAPVRDRFKIFIIDEAHMVSNQGFNALLKLVEEPPEHVKFIFATTEPEKVIGTIRSRTHHYPFRLVPPLDLEKYLARLCAQEGVSASKDVLSLVIRAGTGSVRDTLSVLDQIIGGSDSHSLDYERAVALLGYTSAHLLDEAISAVADRDGAALFSVVDSVVKSGHDPRRFVEDLLQRLRDVVIIALTGSESRDVFVTVPDDQYERMEIQAEKLGAARASRCADITNDALNMMVGATSPRLQLELLCARLVVAQAEITQAKAPSSPETHVPEGGQVSTPPQTLSKWKKPSAQESAAQRQTPPPAQPEPQRNVMPEQVEEKRPAAPTPVATQAPVVAAPMAPPALAAPQEPAKPERSSHVPSTDMPKVPPRRPENLPESASAQARAAASNPAHVIFDKISAAWPQILSNPHLGGLVKNQLNSGARLHDIADNTLRIAFKMPAVATRFNQRGSGQHVAEVIREVLKIDVGVEAIPDDGQTHPKAEAAPKPAQVSAPAAPPRHQEKPVEPPIQYADPADFPPEPSWEEEEPIPDTRNPKPVTDPVDPAGILADLVEGRAQMKGGDHVSEPAVETPAVESPVSEPTRAESVLVEGSAPAETEPVPSQVRKEDDVPFFTQPMPAIPPMEYPGHGVAAQASAQPQTQSSPVIPQVSRQGEATASKEVKPPFAVPARAEKRPVWEVHPPEKEEKPAGNDWEEVSEDDPDISESSLVGLKVLLNTFDARIIEEIDERTAGE